MLFSLYHMLFKAPSSIYPSMSRRQFCTRANKVVIAVAFLLSWILVSATSSVEDNASIEVDASNISDNSSFDGPYDVHVYVTNKDDDSLDVSLFIDSELKETKSVSSDSEAKFDGYSLSKGIHRFKITWWDEDVKKSFESEDAKDVQEETSVNLYTTLNDEPEKFDLAVKLTNENTKDLVAYLYVDDNFEKNKEISGESTSDMGTLSLEEGVHNISVRWRDKDTKIEYVKKKKVVVTKDDAVIFYVPAGISFDAVESTTQSSKYSGSYDEKDEVKAPTSEDETSIANTTNETSSEAIAQTAPSIEPDAAYTSRRAYLAASDSSSKRTNAFSSAMMDDSISLYVYVGLVILAVYLIFRH